MNRLRSQKFKLNNSLQEETKNNNNNNNNNSSMNNNSLLNKISKRYSTLSNKIIRRSHVGRSRSPQNIISGSYDMTGALSEDHRLEIGAPILISSTTLDADRFDVSEERLKMIGGGVAALRTVPVILIDCQQKVNSSSGSENEMYVDALSTPPMESEDKVDNLKMETQKQIEVLNVSPHSQDPEESVRENFIYESSQKSPISQRPSKESSPESIKSQESDATPVNQMSNLYESTRNVRSSTVLPKKNHSQSAFNLHKSELFYLKKAPSMNFKGDQQLDDILMEDLEQNLPKLPELYGTSKCSLAATDNEVDDDCEADKENSSPSMIASVQSKSEPNTPLHPEKKRHSFLSQQKVFQSAENLSQRRLKRRSVMFSSTTSMNRRDSCSSMSGAVGSKTSVMSQISNFDDYDLKSVSCQSLNPQTLFVSIDELNEITRQINESEEFNQYIDLEYCNHRDQLKPSERRITLMKNKNSRIINFTHNKEKIKKSWSGVKHWIGEEGLKIKDVVQRQPLMQKMSSSRLNLNVECKNSPSVNGSVPAKQRPAIKEKSLDDSGGDSKLNSSSSNPFNECQTDTSPVANLNVSSCDTIADDSNEINDSLEGGEDNSPSAKKARQEGQNGFEELRRYIKQGGDFGKELIIILQERIDSELMYSKSLSKMANKLNKACRELPGTIAEAWRGVATEMETRSDIHRQLSASLAEEIIKPLKTIVEGHHKTRKSVESNVDKASRVLTEWRASEAKGKKSSHAAARENEKLQDAMLDVRIQKSPSIALLHQSSNKQAAEKELKSAEKDCAKLDNKRKKAEEAVKRADVEYYTLCVRAERARVDWEMSVLRGSSILQNIENQRLINMKNFVSNYARLTANMNPILESLIQRLEPQVDNCNVVKDMQIVKNIRRNAEGPSEQLLPDFYCEHTTLAMNRERRKHALVKLLQLVKTDLERERRSRNGLKNLSQSLNSQEHQNITDKLYHIRSMLTYLEGARFKLHSALLELDHKPRSDHPLAQHIQITRDRTGLQQSILKVPLWLKNNDKMNSSNSGDDGNDYDTISQANTTTSTSNISCLDNHSCVATAAGEGLKKSFGRSKSNIETISTKTQICVKAGNEKTKTLNEATNLYDDDCVDGRGQADGGSNQQDSDFDEFSSQDDDDEHRDVVANAVSGRKEHKNIIEKSLTANGINHVYQNTGEIQQQQQQQILNNSSTTVDNSNVSLSSSAVVVLGRCKALYNYTPKLYDELELRPGDIIEVHAKQDDGWWLGALRNQVGIFPATYVEEIA